jgi:hypothetical protein
MYGTVADKSLGSKMCVSTRGRSELVDVSPCSLVGFRKLVLDPLKSTISGYFDRMVEKVRKRRNDS